MCFLCVRSLYPVLCLYLLCVRTWASLHVSSDISPMLYWSVVMLQIWCCSSANLAFLSTSIPDSNILFSYCTANMFSFLFSLSEACQELSSWCKQVSWISCWCYHLLPYFHDLRFHCVVYVLIDCCGLYLSQKIIPLWKPKWCSSTLTRVLNKWAHQYNGFLAYTLGSE